jgi:hypothetical protein
MSLSESPLPAFAHRSLADCRYQSQRPGFDLRSTFYCVQPKCPLWVKNGYADLLESEFRAELETGRVLPEV